jgi:hypothetical protein
MFGFCHQVPHQLRNNRMGYSIRCCHGSLSAQPKLAALPKAQKQDDSEWTEF